MIKGLMTRWRAARVKAERQRALRNIRETFAFFGYPVDDMTDEALEQGVVRIAQTMSRCGLSVDDAGRALQQFARALP
jgi:hypothetical protein